MKRTHSKLVMALMVLGLFLVSGSVVFANPNDQVIGAVQGSSLPGSYSSQITSFLRDSDKVLTQESADAICGNIYAAEGILQQGMANGGLTDADMMAIQGCFDAACGAADYVVAEVATQPDGGATVTVYDPESQKSATIQGNATSVAAASSSAGTAGTVAVDGGATTEVKAAASGTTVITKTGLDNRLFIVAGLLGLLTIGISVVLYRKSKIQS
ncbi:hypothetical protein [Acetobacterium sp.]|uniref:hypothetical protein n=1 Tax=Acetobacterium sp. TaxID=1872094 RepID=UPI000CBB02E1|nr:hypothetical protein [Acetobacterium sp.]MDO9493737.1 hypothetical protein [Acetobacterium sp.]PKM75513.1 MAG: hypothetical protein CVU92_01010 [Firmicutes bacterium HGW-Firmicutes-17]